MKGTNNKHKHVRMNNIFSACHHHHSQSSHDLIYNTNATTLQRWNILT